jgi:hypothetical protein
LNTENIMYKLTTELVLKKSIIFMYRVFRINHDKIKFNKDGFSTWDTPLKQNP